MGVMFRYISNETAMEADQTIESLTSDDAAWALTCAFLILTMQTGFAMLEGGMVSAKNTANIMVKNLVDVSLGGLGYWMFGYGLSFGKPSTPFSGLGSFFFHDTNLTTMGDSYSHYFFQFSFASTATTIVSGAVAERIKLRAYMVFAFFNIIVYCIPASWAWGEKGFLRTLKFFDFAGVTVVHLNGGTSAFVATLLLGPRHERFSKPENYAISSPVTSLTGMFMLTWAWLGFNCGSTFGISAPKWKISAVVAVTTLNGAIGGGVMGLILSASFHRGQILIHYVINSLLGGLVSVTGCCAVVEPWEALLIGAMGAAAAIGASHLLVWLKVDDPVGAIPVHFFAAFLGTMATGIFGKDNLVHSLQGYSGLIHGGGFYRLGVSLLGALCISLWSGLSTLIILLSLDDELLGADYVEHAILHSVSAKEQKIAELVQAAEKKSGKNGIHDVVELFERINGILISKPPRNNLNPSPPSVRRPKNILDPIELPQGSRVGNDVDQSPINHAYESDLPNSLHLGKCINRVGVGAATSSGNNVGTNNSVC